MKRTDPPYSSSEEKPSITFALYLWNTTTVFMKNYIWLVLASILWSCANPESAPQKRSSTNINEKTGISDPARPSAGRNEATPSTGPGGAPPGFSDPTADLDCKYDVIRENFQSDPRFPDIVKAVQDFEDYQNEMDPDELAAVVTEFTRIYMEFARPHKPCSEDYMAMYENTGKAEEYARRMCHQMELSQYFNEKFPCLKKLTNEQKMTLILE